MYTRKASLLQISEDLRSGELDLIKYINDTCDWIEATEPIINALLPEKHRRERLLQEANNLLNSYPEPDSRPSLFGVLVGVKDLFNVDGFPTQAGSTLPPDVFAGPEAEIITNLKNMGILILGKTVSTEFAYFQPGPTSNPINPNHTPGGSSSGSAAATAAGYCPLAFGTQTIASVIRPASFCGITGMKPSFGRISTQGVFPFSQSADHIGFFAQTVNDLELAASCIIPNWKHLVLPDYAPVIGVPTGSFIEQADKESLAHFFMEIVRLGEAGFEMMNIDVFPDIEEINANHKKLIAYEFAMNHKDLYQRFASLYSPHSQHLIQEGSAISTQEHKNLVANQIRFRCHLENIMTQEGIDLWICPSTTSVAPAGLESTGSPLMSLPWTHAGFPSVTIPLREDYKELPLGLQVIGRFNEDEFVIHCLKIIKTK